MTIIESAAALEADLTALAARILEERSPERLRSLMAAGCWIYGAGSYGRRVQGLLASAGIHCLGFVDQRANSPEFSSPEGVATVTRDHFTTPPLGALIVAIHNFNDDLTSTVEWANAAGFSSVLTPGELPDVLGAEAGGYWLTSRRHTARHIPDIVNLARTVSDIESLDVLRSIATFRLTGNVKDQPWPDQKNQYIPITLKRIKEPVYFVDGGAFDGDTFRSFQRESIIVSDWVAFEPDLQNFAKLSRTAADIGSTRATLFPCGLGSRTETLSFSDGGGAASSLTSATGPGASTIQVMVVALDEVLLGAHPTFVKLDVEGAEADALNGMKRIIAACRPSLAVSVYHKPSDLWELPTLVKALYQDVDLSLRQHGYNGFDTVLYVNPR